MADKIDICPTATATGVTAQSSSRTLTKPSPLEAKNYYAGLPSAPILVARTSTTPWEVPTGPEAHTPCKELRILGNHVPGFAEAWEGGLAQKVQDLLESMDVKWTSLDVVRIGFEGEHFAPVVLWIGVIPSSLSGEDGVVAASRCRDLLVESDFSDIDVEIRESVVTRWGSVDTRE
jgi:hypothetical protein